MKTKFTNYKLSREEKRVASRFEGQSGFELIGTEDVVDKKSFIACIKLNHRWLSDWSEEVIKGSEKELRKLKYYMEVVLK